MHRRVLLISSLSSVVVAAGLALSAVAFGPAQAAVGPLPAAALALPGSTRVLAGFDVARFVRSPLYARVLKEKGDDPFKDVRERLAIDPARDLDLFVIAGGGANNQPLACMAFGRFDRTALARAIEKEKGVTWKDHAGTTLYLFDETSRKPGALAFLDDETVVAGERRAVEQVLDNSATSLRTNTQLLAQLQQVQPGSAFWMVGDSSALSRLPLSLPAPGAEPGSGSKMELPALQGVTVSADLDPLIALDIVGEAKDAAAAGKLADVVRGLLALATLQGGQRPELREMASGVSVTSDGARVRVGLRVSYELLEAFNRTEAGPTPKRQRDLEVAEPRRK